MARRDTSKCRLDGPVEGVRLLHVTTVPESLGFMTGQVGFMKERGIEVACISSPGPALAAFAEVEGVRTFEVSMARRITPLEDLAALRRLRGILKEFAPHIVHAHTPKGGMLGTLAGWLAGTPVRIYHMRGLPMLGAAGLRRQLLRCSERVACALAHHVVCVSHSIRELAVREGLCRQDKIAVMASGSGNGVDAVGLFDPHAIPASAVAAARAALELPREAPLVGFVGRIVRDKGARELLDAWRLLREELPDLHLVLIGDSEPHDPLPAAIERAFREDPRVRITGYLPKVRLPALYAILDVVALPTYREGFPNVALEAAAMETPIVATKIPGCVDAVLDGVTGTLVPPRDGAALAAALRAYLREPALGRGHGEAGRRRALQDFRPQAIWEAIHEEYRSLLDERSAFATVSGPGGHGAARVARARRPSRAYSAVKRTLDLAVASIGLVLLLPILATVALLILATMGRPAIFRQTRPGKDERPFRLFKFRTMRDGEGADATRITRLGALLRKTSLDELPALWNVLRGELSLVGPRPLLTRYLPCYTPRERLRSTVRPGITGWSQIHGRNEASWDERLANDVWYVDHRSLTLDLKILLLTLSRVVRGSGVVVDARSIMKNLDEERATGTTS